MTWAEVEKLGRVAKSKAKGWHVEFRTVYFPGARSPRRVQITRTDDAGKITSKAEATRVLKRIQARAMDAQLEDVLAAYLGAGAPENSVLWRYERVFLPVQRAKFTAGKITKKRLAELRGHLRRGHFAPFGGLSVVNLDFARLSTWELWLTGRGLGPKSIKCLMVDLKTFLRFLHKRGQLAKVPDFPTVDVPDYEPKIPTEEGLESILSRIPEDLRGIFLARSLMGLRPSEARRLNVSAWQGEILSLPPLSTKTKRGRKLELHPELGVWLEKNRAGAHPWEPLFTNPLAKNPERRWTVLPERRIWHLACDDAGVERVRPNEGGRHAFASHAVRRGADIYAVRTWLGHRETKTTERYARLEAVPLARILRPRER